MGGTGDGKADGRSLRRTRNQEAVLDAVIELFEEGDIEPSVDAIAERAGVSNRSIYRYFEHRDQLMRAAIAHAMRRVLPELRMPDEGQGNFEHRVRRFVDHRLGVYLRLARITRAAKVAARSEPMIREEFETGRMVLRQSFLDQFAEEFAPLGARERKLAVVAAELAFQFESFEFLWSSTDGQVDDMRTILVDQLLWCLGRLRPTVGS